MAFLEFCSGILVVGTIGLLIHCSFNHMCICNLICFQTSIKKWLYPKLITASDKSLPKPDQKNQKVGLYSNYKESQDNLKLKKTLSLIERGLPIRKD